MCRTGMCRFGIGNWIFLIASAHLFTYVQGVDDILDEGVRLTAEPLDLVVAEGESALLACAARGGGARLTWRHRAQGDPTRDDAISAEDKYRKQLQNGSLVIESMAESLAGQYQCVASGAAGSVVSRVAAVFLAEVPPLVPGPRSVLGAAGAPALLPCAVAAPARLAVRLGGPEAAPERRVYSAGRLHTPPPVLHLNVTWLKNGSPVRLEAARVAITPSGALELDPLREHDAANYRCRVALSPHKHRTSEEIELRVSPEPAAEEAPRFIATPRPLTVIEGASVTFDCAAVGNPRPEMIWLNNGVAIDLNDLDSRFYLVGSGSLRVQGARALDAGAYTCRAHSRLDSADAATSLHVLTAPRAVIPGGASTRARERGDVTLRCDVRGRPPPRVVWLKDGEPLSPNQHDIALVDGSSLRIQGVLRVDAGMFQCAAASSAGSAAASVRLVVLPPDDVISHPRLPNTTDIFNSLISSEDPSDYDSDFLGETSLAYTAEPEYDYTLTEGLDVGRENATIVSAPQGLRAVIVKHRFVTLSWQEPERKLEEIVGYVVVYRVKGSERERVSRGSANRVEMNVAALQPNTTYQFAARALTANAISPPTEMIEAHTTPEEFSFGPPTGVRVEPLGPHSLRVRWSAPAPAPASYTVHYTELESGREQVVTASAEGSGEGTATLSGLRAAAAYSVVVAGSGGAAAGPVRARTVAAPPSAPPGNVSAEPASPTSILVRWEAPPARTQRGALTGYKVRFRAAGARGKAASLTTPADVRRAELKNLAPHTTYQIRVCAINVNGSGPFSEWLTAATAARADEARAPAAPPPLSTRAGRDWISVWWEEPDASGGAARAWTLGWGLGVPDERARALPAAARHHLIRGLESNAEYVISLHASNALGAGPPVYATVRTRADDGDDEDEDEDDLDEDEDAEERPPLIPPVGLKVIMLSGTTAVVYWTDPTLPKGQTATDGRRYVVRWAAAAAGAGAGAGARFFNATDLNCMLDDLKPFTLYEFAVKLIKGGQESAWSMLVSNTTLEAAPSSPPRDLRAAPAAPAARAADLAWAPPAKPNGIITGYVIMYAPESPSGGGGGEGEWTALSVAGERTRARVDRLRPRTTYSFKLQARNSKGLGPFCAPVSYTTGVDTGGGGGLAGATSAWLWASAGGACAVLALAAALALSLCCRRAPPPLSPHTSTYQKSSASAGIKPPDLWIHHDQMELKHLDKSLHSSHSKISAGSVDGPSALASSTLTLPRPEYEPARHAPASLERRHVPVYVESRSPSCADSDDTAPMRASPAIRCDRCHYTTMTGAGCAATCERRALRPPRPDQSTPLLAGMAPLGSPMSSLGSLPPHHTLPPPCGSGACPLGAACGPAPAPAGDIYACAARERGHYVAYEPLGHYTHRDSVSSEAGPGPGVPSGAGSAAGSLSRRPPAAPLHSFADSPHSTPSHGHGSVRETSPYKKSANSSPGHIPNRLQLGGSVPHCAEELEALTPSRSTERLAREMQNLEGLMKDLSAITQQQFHC